MPWARDRIGCGCLSRDRPRGRRDREDDPDRPRRLVDAPPGRGVDHPARQGHALLRHRLRGHRPGRSDDVKDADTNQVLATQDLPGQIQSVIPALALGTHHYVATWPGIGLAAEPERHAHRPGRGHHGRRHRRWGQLHDFLSLQGRLPRHRLLPRDPVEPISVSIRVYRPTGSLLRRGPSPGRRGVCIRLDRALFVGSLIPSGSTRSSRRSPIRSGRMCRSRATRRSARGSWLPSPRM